MKYVIIGGGPCGCALTYMLSTNGHEVELIERDKQLGGSWNAQWQEQKYWSENSPRILFKYIMGNNYFFDFLHEIGLKDKDFDNVYGNFLTTNLKFAKYFASNLNLNDFFIFIYSIIIYRFFKSNLTVQEWMDNNDLSLRAKEIIKTFSIIAQSTPNQVNINDFMGSFTIASIKQMREPNKWHEILEQRFKTMPNVKVYKSTEVITINSNNEDVEGIVAKHIVNGNVKFIKGDRYIICAQPNSLLKIVGNCNHYIKNNWNSFEWLKQWANSSTYSGFGFQLHFREKIDFPKDFCWGCNDAWNVIMENIGKWLNTKSKDPLVNTVWSCCLVDMETKSHVTNKTPNQSSKQEIIDECMRQIKERYKKTMNLELPKPYKITFSEGIYRLNNKWHSKNTGFSMNKLGYIQEQGNIANLYTVGSHVGYDYNFVGHSGTSLQAVVNFIEREHPELTSFHNKNHNYRLIIIALMVLFLFKYHKNIFKN